MTINNYHSCITITTIHHSSKTPCTHGSHFPALAQPGQPLICCLNPAPACSGHFTPMELHRIWPFAPGFSLSIMLAALALWFESESCSVGDSMDYTVHGILQARILEWVALPFSRESSQPRDQTQVSCIAGRFLTV